MLRFTVVIFLSCGFTPLLTGCQRSDAAPGAVVQEPPIRVVTALASERVVPEYLTLTGSLLADKESDIAADANGRVLTTKVERGQAVKQGELLATLDASAAALNARAAAAQEQFAKTQASQAKVECERSKRLFDSGAISRAEFDRSMTQCTGSEWSVAAAAAQHGSAAKVVRDSAIRAPFSGVIGERYVNVGQYVQPNTAVVSLYSIDPLRLELSVPEANVGLIRQDLPLTFRVSAYGDEGFTGKVRFISPHVRQASRDLVVEALVPNAEGRLRPGMFAIVRLEVGQKPGVVVPLNAVRKDLEPPRAYAVVAGQIEERVLQLGEVLGDVVAVGSGAKVGDAFVVDPPKTIHDGQRVQ